MPREPVAGLQTPSEDGLSPNTLRRLTASDSNQRRRNAASSNVQPLAAEPSLCSVLHRREVTGICDSQTCRGGALTVFF